MLQLKTLKKIHPAYVLLVIILIFTGKKLFLTSGKFIGGIDVANVLYWYFQFIKDQVLAGNLPIWNPHICCGVPFFPTPLFYPSTLLFMFLPIPVAFNIDTILHIFIAGLGIYFFVYQVTESKSAGLSSAIVFCLSGYSMDRIYAGHLLLIHSAAIMPWIFLFVEKSFRKQRYLNIIIAGFLLGIQALTSDIQDTYYIALFITLFFFLRCAISNKDFKTAKDFLRSIFYYTLIPIVSFGIAAILILPSYEVATLSVRSESTYEFATHMSFTLRDFFAFLIPKISSNYYLSNWEMSGYIGLPAIILAIIGICFSNYKKYTFCFGMMLFIAVTIMLGANTPVYKIYYRYLPGISSFHIPARCVIIFVFIMSVSVGFGVHYLLEEKHKKFHYYIITIIITVFLFCIYAGAKAFYIPFTSEGFKLALILIACSFFVFNFFPLIKNRYIPTSFIVFLLFFNLYFVYSHRLTIIDENELIRKSKIEQIIETDNGLFRVVFPFLISASHHSPVGGLRGMKFKYYDANGYAGYVNLKNYFKFVYEMADLSIPKFNRHWLDLRLFTKERVFSSKVLNIKYAIVKTPTGRFNMISTKKLFPRALLIDHPVFLRNLDEQLSYMKSTSFNPLKQVLLLSSDRDRVNYYLSHKSEEVLQNGPVHITKYQANRIELSAVSNKDSYLVLSEIYYPGWIAYVDGKDVPIFQADYLLRSIPLTKGNHNIVFVFRPRSLMIGAAITALTFLFITWIFIVQYRKKESI